MVLIRDCPLYKTPKAEQIAYESNKMNIVTQKNTVQISVRKLVEYRQRTGDLDLTFFSAISPLEGIRLHKKIQESRHEGVLTGNSGFHGTGF
jgi:hypothetical protein